MFVFIVLNRCRKIFINIKNKRKLVEVTKNINYQSYSKRRKLDDHVKNINEFQSLASTVDSTQSVQAKKVIENINSNDDNTLNSRKFEVRKNYTIANAIFYKQLFAMFSNWIMLIICSTMIIFYYLSNDYYQCGNYLSNFSVTYYYFDKCPNGNYFHTSYSSYITISQTIVALSHILFNGTVFFYLYRMIKMTKLGQDMFIVFDLFINLFMWKYIFCCLYYFQNVA